MQLLGSGFVPEPKLLGTVGSREWSLMQVWTEVEESDKFRYESGFWLSGEAQYDAVVFMDDTILACTCNLSCIMQDIFVFKTFA